LNRNGGRERRTSDATAHQTTAPDWITVLGGGVLEFCVGKLLEFGADLSAWDEETRRAEAA
jgi:hypothetical protein